MELLEACTDVLRRHYDALLQIPEGDGIIFTHAAREGNDQTRTGMTLAELKPFRMHDFPLWPAEMVPHGSNGYALFSHDAEERDFMHQIFKPYAEKLKDRIDNGLCVVAGGCAAWFLAPLFYDQMCGQMELIKYPCEWYRSHQAPYAALMSLAAKVGGGFFESEGAFLQTLGKVYSEQRRAYWASLTEEQREEVSEQRRAYWASLTEEQREEVSEQRRAQATDWWAVISEEELNRISEKHKARWAHWTDEERGAIFQKARDTRAAWTEEEWQAFRDNISAAKKAATPEIKAAIIAKYKEAMAARTEEEKAERLRKISEARLNRSEEELAEARKKMAEAYLPARASEAHALRVRFEAGEMTAQEMKSIVKNGKERRKYREEHPGTAICAEMEALFEDVQATVNAEERIDTLAIMHSKQKEDLLQRTLEGRAKFEAGLLSVEEEEQIIRCGKARANKHEDDGGEVLCPEADELFCDVLQRRDERRAEADWSRNDQSAQALMKKYSAEAEEQMVRFQRGELSDVEKNRIIINGNTRKRRRQTQDVDFYCAPLEELYEVVLAASNRLDRKTSSTLNMQRLKEARAPAVSEQARKDLIRFENGELSEKEKLRIIANGHSRKKRRVEGDAVNEDLEKLYQAVLQKRQASRSTSRSQA